MSVIMTAYTNSSEASVVNKQVAEIGNYSIRPTDNMDIEKPKFIVKYSDSLIPCNYIHVPKYNRYYFAWITTKPGGEAIIDCLSDPLMSFWDDIKNCDFLALRNAGIGKPSLYTDNQLPVYPNKKNVTSIVMPVLNDELSTNYLDGSGLYYMLTVISGTPSLQKEGEKNGT